MKGNAIARIIIYCIIIAILLGALAIGLGLRLYSVNFHTGVYTEGSTTLDADDVQSIHIEWVTGTITLIAEDTDEITVAESAGSNLDKYTMVTECTGGKLTVRYSEKITIGIGTNSVPEKDLTIIVPKDWTCKELSIETASTDIYIENQIINRFQLDSADGDCELENCQIQNMVVNTASCNLTFSGTLTKMDCDGASARLTLVCNNVPDSIDLDGASAELHLTLPEDCGFRVEQDGLSCSFGSDFGHHSSDGCHSYGNEHCRIDVDGMSTTVYIHKAEHHEDSHH